MFYSIMLKSQEFDKLNRHTIDVFDRLDNLFQRHDFTHSMSSKYPPHNILKRDNSYLLEMAIAGFHEDEVSITKEKDYLTIEGKKEQKPDEQLVYQGIATRSFKKVFGLGDRMQVVGAEMKNGMLYVGLQQEIPEEEKPQEIKIGGDKKVMESMRKLIS